MSTTVFRYLKENKEITVFWLGTILAWVLYAAGVNTAGRWLFICALGVFTLLLYIGHLRDTISRLQDELNKLKS